MLEIYPHLPSPFSFFFLFLPQKNGGKFEKDSYLFQIPHHVFLIASYKDIENSILQPNAFMMR